VVGPVRCKLGAASLARWKLGATALVWQGWVMCSTSARVGAREAKSGNLRSTEGATSEVGDGGG
jgi:hypothetical protein